jgi:excisionase family DNA binding protein
MASDAVSPIEGRIEEAVERAVERLLRPYLRRICEPEPAVYTVAQAAVVLQVSEDTVARLVRRGVLHRVPHVGGKVLIPRAAVDELLTGLPSQRREARSAAAKNVSPLRSAFGP